MIGTSIDKYCYLTCRQLPPFFDHKYRIVYSKIELTRAMDVIEHPAVRAVLQSFNLTEGIEITHVGDLPAQSGIGSSSSFVVGLLHAIYAMQLNLIR